MIAAIALMAQAADLERFVAVGLEKTRGARRCVVDLDSTDVSVCGLRNADRYRPPFENAAPLAESVSQERNRLLHRTTPVQDMGPFLVGGGAAGISLTTGGGKTELATLRQLAP